MNLNSQARFFWDQTVISARYWPFYRGWRDRGLDWLLRLSVCRLGRRLRGSVKLRLRSSPRAFHCRWSESDIFSLEEVYLQNEYERARSLGLPNSGVVVDLGTNAGIAARYLAEVLRPELLVCVEPDEGTMSLAKVNLNPTDLGVRVVFRRAFIGGRAGFAQIETDALAFERSMRGDPTNGATSPNAIPVVTIGTLLSELEITAVSFLKMDIEGAERAVFEESDLGFLTSTAALCVEVHQPLAVEWLPALLERNGFDFQLFTDPAKPNGHFVQWFVFR